MRFNPSEHSYGAEAEESKKGITADQLAIAQELIVGDPRQAEKRLVAKLWTLQHGGPVEKRMAAAPYSVATAIQRTQLALAEAQSQAAQTRGRDWLFTLAAVGAVAVTGTLTAYLYAKTRQADRT